MNAAERSELIAQLHDLVRDGEKGKRNKVAFETLEDLATFIDAKVHRAVLTAYAGGQADIAAEYADEAEHQDGLEYWAQFESYQAMFEDFDIYRAERAKL
jgi:hypothetical protein